MRKNPKSRNSRLSSKSNSNNRNSLKTITGIRINVVITTKRTISSKWLLTTASNKWSKMAKADQISLAVETVNTITKSKMADKRSTRPHSNAISSKLMRCRVKCKTRRSQ